jgi:hypothetical protein
MQGDVHRFCANALPFYIRDMSIFRFGYPLRVLEPIPCVYRGMTYNAQCGLMLDPLNQNVHFDQIPSEMLCALV